MRRVAMAVAKSCAETSLPGRLAAWAATARARTVLRNVAFAFGGRAVNLCSTFLAVPIVVSSLGTTGYGAFAVILSVGTFMAYSDFGLGAALVSDVAISDAEGDRRGTREVVTQGLVFLSICGLVLVAVSTAFWAFGAVDHLLVVIPAQERGIVWSITVVSAAAGVPLALAHRIFYALQMGPVGQSWATAMRLSVLATAPIAAHMSPTIGSFALVFMAAPVVISVAASVHLFVFLRPDLRPDLRTLTFRGLRRRATTGINFTVLQVLFFVETGLDTIILAQFVDGATVAQFDLLSRLMGYVPALVQIGIGPLWPAVAAAAAQGDERWIRAARPIAYAAVPGIAALAAAGLYLGAPILVHLWTGVHLTMPHVGAIAAALACYVVVNTFGSTQSMFLNAFRRIGAQTSASAVALAVLVPAKYLLISHGLLWCAVAITAISYLPRLVWLEAIVRQRIGGHA